MVDGDEEEDDAELKLKSDDEEGEKEKMMKKPMKTMEKEAARRQDSWKVTVKASLISSLPSFHVSDR